MRVQPRSWLLRVTIVQAGVLGQNLFETLGWLCVFFVYLYIIIYLYYEYERTKHLKNQRTIQ